MSLQNWNVHKSGQIASLMLNRPESSNNLNEETMLELRDVSKQLGDDPAIRVVVLEGQGDHFCTGIDLQMVRSRLDLSIEKNRDFLLRLQRCLDDFENLEKPTIAKLKGFCIGGGVLLAVCCDFRIASERTIFSLPEIKLGLPILWGTKRITRIAGPAHAKEMVLLGGRFKARQALTYGLVHQVVPAHNLDEATQALAEKLSKFPQRAMGLAKSIIHAGMDLGLRESQDLEVEALSSLMQTPETRMAFERYAESRLGGNGEDSRTA